VLPITAARCKSIVPWHRVFLPFCTALQQSCGVVALHDCCDVCLGAQHVLFLTLLPFCQVNWYNQYCALAQHDQTSFAKLALALDQCYIEIVHLVDILVRSGVLKAIGKEPNEDMIAGATTRPGTLCPLWRKLTIAMTWRGQMPCPRLLLAEIWSQIWLQATPQILRWL
jgi:hypothetical protein